MSFRTARQWSWVFALLLVFGCATQDLRGVIAEYKPKVEPQLAKLAAIRAAARGAPPVAADDVDINGPAPRIGVTDVDEHANVAIEYLEDLDDPTALGNVPFRILGSGSMNRCAAIFATHRYPYDPLVGTIPDEIPWYVAQSNLKHCEVVRYVFVIRSLAYASPSAVRDSTGPCPNPSGSNPDAGAPDAGARAKCEVFDGGYLNAEVLVFDMKSGAQIGGFRFTAESSPRIDVARSSDHSAQLGPDFSLKIRTAFNEAAQKWVPSFTVGN